MECAGQLDVRHSGSPGGEALLGRLEQGLLPGADILLAQAHQNILAIKIDGATKEEFVWGLRVGFITYGVKGGTKALYDALEQKTGANLPEARLVDAGPREAVVLH